MHQTVQEYEWSVRLMLNGRALQLGTVADIVDEVWGRRTVGIALEYDADRRCEWRFTGEREEMSMIVDEVKVDEQVIAQPTQLHCLLPQKPSGELDALAECLRSLTYITAERVGPRHSYELADRQRATSVGARGELASSVLYWGGGEEVLPRLVLPEAPPMRIRQVEARMRTFFPTSGLTLEPVPKTNSVILGLRTSNETGFHRPVHVGFGFTQVLPIVVAALSVPAGAVLMIENPEVHLHPSAQALMGSFLADVADAGIQVLVETHSDHVLNGIRRAVRVRPGLSEATAIHYFAPRTDGGPQVTSPSIDSNGNIDAWPAGFFDQFDRDANFLAGWGE